MKKFLLSFVLAIGMGLLAYADSKTFTFNGSGTVLSTMKDSPLELSFAKNNSSTAPSNYSDGLRIYYNSSNGGSVTISCEKGYKLTQIDFTYTNSYPLPSGAANTGTLTNSGTSGTWKPGNSDVTSVTFSNTQSTNKQVRIPKIVVNYESTGSSGGGTTEPEPEDPTTGGDEEGKTATLNTTNFNGSGNSYAKYNYDLDDIYYTSVFAMTSSTMQFNTNNSNGKASAIVVKENKSDYIIESIDVTFGTVGNGVKIYSHTQGFGDLTLGSTPTIPAGATQVESALKANKQNIPINAPAFAIYPAGTGVIQVSSVTVHYKKSSSTPGEPQEYKFPEVANSLTALESYPLNLGKSYPASISITALNSDIASISGTAPSFVITANKAGEATFKAEWDNDDNFLKGDADFTITVNKKAPALSFPSDAYTVKLGESFSSPVLSAPEGLTVKYSSTNPEVATVGADGRVEILSLGSTVIKATSDVTDVYEAGEASYTLDVVDTVTATVVFQNQDNLKYGDGTEITWVSEEGDYKFKTSATITGQTYPTKSGNSLRIYNSNGNTITVNAPEGYYFMSASYVLTTAANHIAINGTDYSDKNNICTFTGQPTSFELTSVKSNNNNNSDVTSFTFVLGKDDTPELGTIEMAFADESKTLNIGESYANTLTVVPADLAGDVTYSSSDSKVASVDEKTGEVKAIKRGKTTITASFAGNAQYKANTASYDVTVVDPNAENYIEANLPFDNDWQFPGASEWNGNAYAQRVVEYDLATITFASASKQGGTVTTCPVVKSGPITIEFNDNIIVHGITVNFTQWNTKKKTAYLLLSEDGVKYEQVAESSDFVISADVPANIRFAQINFSENSEQVGVASIDLVYEQIISGDNPGLSFRYSKITGKEGVGFAAQAAYHLSPGEITYSSSNPEVVDVIPETGMFDNSKPCNVGITTITAVIAACDGYSAGRATYQVEIEPVGTSTSEATFNFNEPSTLDPAYDVTSSTVVSDVTFTSNNVKLVGTKGSNTDAQLFYYSGSKGDEIQYRIYQGAALTISAPDGSYITKVDFGFSSTSPSMGSFYREGISSVKYGPSYSQQAFTTTVDEKLTSVKFFVTSGNNIYLSNIKVELATVGGKHFVLSFNDDDRVVGAFVGVKTKLPELQIPSTFDPSAKIEYSIDDPDGEGFKYTIEKNESSGEMFVTMHEEPGVYTLRATSEATASQAASSAILRLNVYPTLSVETGNDDSYVDDSRSIDNYNLTIVNPVAEGDDDKLTATIQLPSMNGVEDPNNPARFSTIDLSKVEIYESGNLVETYTPAGDDNSKSFSEMDTYTFEDDGKVIYYMQYGSTERFEHPAEVNVVLMPQTPSRPEGSFTVTASKNSKLYYKESSYNPGAKSVAPRKAGSLDGWTEAETSEKTFERPTNAGLSPDDIYIVHYAGVKFLPAELDVDDDVLISTIGVLGIDGQGGLSGIEDVVAGDTADSVYYNLQGIRMTEPLAPGMYIRQTGNTAVKVRIR